MVFSSLTFLWIFLPCVLLVNYLFSFLKNKKIKINDLFLKYFYAIIKFEISNLKKYQIQAPLFCRSELI